MNKKNLIIVLILIVVSIMAYLLFRFGLEEFQTRLTAPYPLADVNIIDSLRPEQSQTGTMPSTKFNVSPEFNITQPIYDQLPMYEFIPGRAFSDEMAAEIPTRLGLNTISNRKDPILGATIIAGRESKNLTLYPEKGEFIYTDLAPQRDSENLRFGMNPNLEPFQAKAQQFINDLGLQNQVFEFVGHNYIHAEVEHADVTTNLQTANILQLRYEAKIEDLSVVDSNSTLIPNTIIVWLNSKAEIAKVHYQATGSIGNAFGNYDLYDVNELRDDLQLAEPKAKLVNGDYPIGQPIESINVTSARLAYLSVENYLVPVYILEASVRTTGNYFGTGYLLMEAIKR